MTTNRFVLRGASVIDGTGGPSRHADVLVGDGRIEQVGTVEKQDDVSEIDLTGLVLAPGFIDVHTHYDAQVLWDPDLGVSRMHGVTTVVVGNCGYGVAPASPHQRERLINLLKGVEGMSAEVLTAGIPWSFESFAEYLEVLRSLPLGLNVAAFIGHSAVRIHVMEEAASERAASPEERARMAEVVKAAVRAGALGFSTARNESAYDDTGRPVPSRVAELAEIYELAEAADEAGARVIEAAEGTDLTVDELASLAGRLTANVLYSALLAGDISESEIDRVLEIIGGSDGCLRAEIIPMPHYHRLSCAVPYDMVRVSTAFKEGLGADHPALLKLYADPEWRARAGEQITTTGAERLARMSISESNARSDLIGTPLADLAEKRGTSLLDALLDVSIEDDLKTRGIYAGENNDEDGIARLLKDHRTVLGLSDAGAHADRVFDLNFPTLLLRRWVRERAEIGLEYAVWRLTGQPAELLKLHERGLIRPGFAADLVAFDPERVGERPPQRVYDLPAGGERLVGESEGIEHVWVNGAVARWNGENLNIGAGTVL
jgi:N-acyl-D-amino-acid deacylase